MKPLHTPGIVSFILIGVSYVIVLINLLKINIIVGGSYLLLLFLAGYFILKNYCTKCSCDNNECAHFLPGKIIDRFFKKLEGSYTKREISITAISFFTITLFPIYWLIPQIDILIMFFLMQFIGFLIITTKVCVNCKNKKCLVKSIKK